MKVKYLPDIPAPYISECGLYKKITTSDEGVLKIPFKNEPITTPCYFYLKLENVENQGDLLVRFYRLRHSPLSIPLRGWSHIVRLLQEAWSHPFPIHQSFIPGWDDGKPSQQPAETTGLVGEMVRLIKGLWYQTALRGRGLPSFDPTLYVRRFYSLYTQLDFTFGQPGAYFGHIIFIDKVAHMPPGPIIYIGTLNGRLIFEKMVTIGKSGEKYPPLYLP